jgi:hypothetical protein
MGGHNKTKGNGRFGVKILDRTPYYNAYGRDTSTKKLKRKHIDCYFQQATEEIQNSGERTHGYD